jgi:hypothetical protein
MLDADNDRRDKSPRAGAKSRSAWRRRLRVYARDNLIGQGRREAATDHIARYRIAPTTIAKRPANNDLYDVPIPISDHK